MRFVVLALHTLLAPVVPQDPVATLREAPLAVRFAGVAERLRSNDLADVAWGGFLAAELELVEATDELRDTLRSLAKRRYGERELASLAVLDALVMVGAKLPGDELTPFRTDLEHDAAFALIAREPEENAHILLHLLQRHTVERGRTVVFVAAGDLLAEARCGSGFAAHLLELLHVDLTIHVVDGAHPCLPSVHVRYQGSCADAILAVPDDHPPVVVHRLTISGRGALLAPGAEPITVERLVQRGPRASFWTSRAFVDRERPARQWLARLLELEEFTMPRQRTVHVDAREVDPRVGREQARRTVEDAFAAIVAMLHGRGFLTSEEAARAEIDILEQVVDFRGR